MVKKFSQNQVERLLDLVPYLTSNQGVALEQVAADFHTDKSTVIDDLNTLWMCGLPGYTPLELIDLSFDTGFVTIRNAEVLSQPRKLSNMELATVIVGLSILRELIQPTTDHHEGVSNLLRRLTSSSSIPGPSSILSSVDPEIRSICANGVKEKSNISIEYHSFAKDVETTRQVYPFGFQVLDGREYLECFCYESKGFRLFRLDRVKSVKISGSTQSLPEERGNTEVSRKFHFKILSESRKVSETFQVAIPAVDSSKSEFESSAFNDEWIIRTFCSLNAAAALTSPADIRGQIHERAKRALALYL
jgi:proteasome accessory factor C